MSGTGVYGIFLIIIFLIIFMRFLKICIEYSNNRRIAQNRRVAPPPTIATISSNENQMDVDGLPPYRQPIKDFDLPPTYEDVMLWSEQGAHNPITEIATPQPPPTPSPPTPSPPTPSPSPPVIMVTVLNEEANKY